MTKTTKTTKADRARKAANHAAWLAKQHEAGLYEVRGIWAPKERHPLLKSLSAEWMQLGELTQCDMHEDESS